MTYLLAVNRSHRGKLPKNATPGQWATFNDAFQTCELTPAEIAAEIRAGHAIAAIHDGRRKRENWRLAQHIGIDLDDGSLSWDDVVSHPLVAAHAAIVHTTASHTPDAPRMRVLFLLEEPIDDAGSYAAVVAAMLRAFSTADPLCKDPSRLFFGAPGCRLLLFPDKRLTFEDIGNIVTAWPPIEDDDAPPAAEAMPAPRAIGFKTPADVMPPSELSPRRKAGHLAALLDRIHTAPDGMKWSTLRDISITIGGYVAGGYLSHAEARAMLQGAIEARRATVASMAHAYATIDESLAHGMLSPLYYTRGDVASAAPIAARRGDFRRQLIADRITELERAIVAAPIDAADLPELIAEYDHLKTAEMAAYV